MPAKSKSTKQRTKVREIPKKTKTLSSKDQKKIKGGQKNFSTSNFNFKVGG